MPRIPDREISNPFGVMCRLWALAAVLFLTLGLTAAASAETINAGPDDLGAALRRVSPGDTILLAPGAYGELLLKEKYGSDAQRVTLRSADPSNPARFEGLKAYGAQGVTLEDLVVDYTYAAGDNKKNLKVSEMKGSRDITLRRILFDGDVATGTGNTGEGFGASFGLNLRETKNILIEDSRFHQWYRGMVVSHSSGFTLRGTEFDAMRSDGVDFAAVTDVLVENNHFHSFQRHADSGDHPDMIQFWTNGTTTPSRNITIRNNVLNAANGAWTQSIFMRNEMVDSKGAGPEMFYRDLTITGNVIINAHLHGITVGETDGLTIANNTLVRDLHALFTNGQAALHTPMIRVAKNSRNVSVMHNIVGKIVGQEDQPNWQVAGNLPIQYANPTAPNFYDDVFVAALNGDPATLAPFTYLPQGPAGKPGLGAPALRMSAQTVQKPVLARATRDARFVQKFKFDAGLTAGVMGPDIRWTFSDGTTATGKTVTHSFPGPGRFTLTADAPGHDPARLILDVPDPQVLLFDEQGLRFHKSGLVRAITDAPVERLSDGRAALAVGNGRETLQLHAGYIAGFFGAGNFKLDLRVRADKSANPAGEILRIHNNIIVTMTPQGQIWFWLNTAETPKPVSIATAPLRLHDGNWHDIGLRYDAFDGRMSVLVDGREMARKQAHGRLRPMESWGLSLGNPFGKKSFDGVISHLDLRSNTAGFAPE